MRLQISELSEQFNAALIAYDEGLQSDDVVLAGAFWRRLYQQGEVAPEHLDHLVKYVRRQVKLNYICFFNLFRVKATMVNSVVKVYLYN